MNNEFLNWPYKNNLLTFICRQIEINIIHNVCLLISDTKLDFFQFYKFLFCMHFHQKNENSDFYNSERF